MKQLITREPVLRYFEKTKEVTLQCDASDSGLGAVIMQQGQPVAFSPRALTNYKNYVQIEKEFLAYPSTWGTVSANHSVQTSFFNLF